MNFQTIGTRILVRRDVSKPVSTGGIIIPDSAQEKMNTGVVVCAGKGVAEVKVGAKVVFGPHAGNEIEIDGEKLWVMLESEIIGFYIEPTMKAGNLSLVPVKG